MLSRLPFKIFGILVMQAVWLGFDSSSHAASFTHNTTLAHLIALKRHSEIEDPYAKPRTQWHKDLHSILKWEHQSSEPLGEAILQSQLPFSSMQFEKPVGRQNIDVLINSLTNIPIIPTFQGIFSKEGCSISGHPSHFVAVCKFDQQMVAQRFENNIKTMEWILGANPPLETSQFQPLNSDTFIAWKTVPLHQQGLLSSTNVQSVSMRTYRFNKSCSPINCLPMRKLSGRTLYPFAKGGKIRFMGSTIDNEMQFYEGGNKRVFLTDGQSLSRVEQASEQEKSSRYAAIAEDYLKDLSQRSVTLKHLLIRDFTSDLESGVLTFRVFAITESSNEQEVDTDSLSLEADNDLDSNFDFARETAELENKQFIEILEYGIDSKDPEDKHRLMTKSFIELGFKSTRQFLKLSEDKKYLYVSLHDGNIEAISKRDNGSNKTLYVDLETGVLHQAFDKPVRYYSSMITSPLFESQKGGNQYDPL